MHASQNTLIDKTPYCFQCYFPCQICSYCPFSISHTCFYLTPSCPNVLHFSLHPHSRTIHVALLMPSCASNVLSPLPGSIALQFSIIRYPLVRCISGDGFSRLAFISHFVLFSYNFLNYSLLSLP